MPGPGIEVNEKRYNMELIITLTAAVAIFFLPVRGKAYSFIRIKSGRFPRKK